MAYQKALLALADPTRRRVFEELKRGPRSVGRIAERMPVSRPAVSQHLRVLKKAGLVGDRAEGTRRCWLTAGICACTTSIRKAWERSAAGSTSSGPMR